MTDDFDPDQYLKEKQASAAPVGDFDPDKYLTEKTGAAPKPAPPKQPTLDPTTTAAIHASRHGAFGLGDKITAAVQALQDVSHDKTGKVKWGDAYNRDLAFNDALLERSDKENPTAKWIGNGIGVGLSTAATLGAGPLMRTGVGSALGLAKYAPKVAAVAPTLGNVVKEGMKAGAAYGGLSGFGGDRSDNAADTAINTGLGVVGGTALGGAGSAALYGGGKLVGAIADKVAPWLKQKGIDIGRRVLTNGADSLSTRQPVRDDAVMEAIESKAIKPFGTTQGTLERLNALTDKEGAKYGNIVEQLEKAGIEGPHAKSLAMALAKEGKSVYQNTADEGLANLYRGQGEALADVAGENERLGLSQAENIKRHLQGKAKYDRTVSSDVNDARRSIASTLRQSIENTIEKQLGEGWNATSGKLSPEIQEMGAQFVPVKQKLGRLLEAEGAATRGAARGAQRAHMSMPEKIALMTEAMSGSPHAGVKALAGSIVLPALRQRLPSTAAVTGVALSNAMRWVSNNLASNPEALGQFAKPLAAAAENGEPALKAMFMHLIQTKPEFAKQLQALDGARAEAAP